MSFLILFGTRSHYVVLGSWGLREIHLPLTPEYKDYRHVPSLVS